MNPSSKIYIAGHTGLVGSAITRRLRQGGFSNLVYRDITELDLTDPRATDAFFASEKPEYVFLAAAKVGGIKANDTYPADFIRINLQIEQNVIDAAHRHGVKKLLFLGSSCIYPKLCPQPMKEEHLLTGKLEPTNDAYAIAKIAGILMCKSYNRQHGTNFIAAMPTNLYGPNDNFDLANSHVLPAMMRKFHEAKVASGSVGAGLAPPSFGGRPIPTSVASAGARQASPLHNAPVVDLWGTGTARREFLHVDDLADALVFLMEHFDADPARPDDLFVNVGMGEDVTIQELAGIIQRAVGFPGHVTWNSAMPDGTPQKLLDVSRLHALGWRHKISLEEGIRKTYEWYIGNRTHP